MVTTTFCETCGLALAPECTGGVVQQDGEERFCRQLARGVRVRSMRRRWPMPAKYGGAAMSEFEDDPRYASIWDGAERIQKAIHGEQRLPSAIFCGPLGTGKSRLAAALVREAWNIGVTAIFATVTDALDRIREECDPKHGDPESDALEDLSQCGLLVLDDLGRERPTEWAAETLWTAYNRRYSHQRLTIVTTNLQAADLRRDERYAALADRMAEEAVVLMMTGPSRRVTAGIYGA